MHRIEGLLSQAGAGLWVSQRPWGKLVAQIDKEKLTIRLANHSSYLYPLSIQVSGICRDARVHFPLPQQSKCPPLFLVLLPTKLLKITFALVSMRQTQILALHTYARKFKNNILFCSGGRVGNALQD